MTARFHPQERALTIPDAQPGQWGSQIFDPATDRFLFEGPRCQLDHSGQPLPLLIPPQAGLYRIYVSRLEADVWDYTRGRPFLILDVAVPRSGEPAQQSLTQTTLSHLRRRRALRALRLVFTLPLQLFADHHRLMRSLVRRDILSRYRGSFGGWFWTVLNPLLLMLTYFFVFGVVLKARFGTDPSRTGFALYFLAGMLPWLAISEALGRSPVNMLEHATFIKKLRFPVEILPANLALAGLVNEGFGLGIFLLGLLAARHSLPLTLLWLPALAAPQMLFTMGLCWTLAALGVFFRDLAQINGFLLTIWFFLTPICYPETAMPREARWLLTKNPVYVLVEGYRAILLQGTAPAWPQLGKLWLVALAVFFLGYAFFHKSRKMFADVI